MKTLLLSTVALAITIILSSCEKVILIELNESDQKIVVDAIVSNDSVQNHVTLSKSGGFYQNTDFEAITGASVTITDDKGILYTLTEESPGYYINPALIGQLKTTYSLEVVSGDQIITGSTYIPDTTHLNSLSYFLAEGGFYEEGWVVLMNWEDEVSEENYYRFKAIVNGSKSKEIALMDDLLINGIETQYPLYGADVNDYDTVTVEFIEIDRSSYDYLKVLGDIASGADAGSAAPGNPDSNLSGGALGFFGGYAISYSTIVIEP